MNQDTVCKVAPRVPSPRMLEAGQALAIAQVLLMDKHSVEALWKAMWDEAPKAPRNSANKLLSAVSSLALQSGERVEKLIDWLADEGGLQDLYEARFIQPNDSSRLQFLLPVVTGGPQADSHAQALAAALTCGKTGMAVVDAAMGIAQAAAIPRHPGYLIQVSPACLNLYLTARADEDDEGGKLPPRTRDVRQAHWYAEKKHAEQAMGHAVKEWPDAEFRVVDLPPLPPGGY